ncbi:hypothetical protein AB9P05_04695 [Roseivirga sp. BDSF3-8]|uniref:hypothetical protein n=1 Tax=Roseivirga sp. BDSF3-8 TaxID=3241598 RepID=UPI003532323A
MLTETLPSPAESRPVIPLIGTATNLLYGYNPAWLSQGQGNNALFPVPGNPLTASEAPAPSVTAEWSFPYISLHESATSLMDELLPYEIDDPSDGIDSPALPSGALMLGDSDHDQAISRLSDTLGVNLAAADTGFVLVKLVRKDDTASHSSRDMGVLIHPNPSRIPDELGVSDEYTQAMGSLKRVKPRGAAFSPDKVSAEDANGYLDCFRQLGTHFISRMELGDMIFQVYAMPSARFERVKKIYADQKDKLSGPQAELFRQYTTDANTGAFGYVSEYGRILSLSLSSKIQDTVTAGDWMDDKYAEHNSLFAAFNTESPVSLQKMNADFREVTALRTYLTSLTLYTEHSRKQIWRRVFKAAAVQKYGDAIKPNFVSYCPYGSESGLAKKLSQNELPGFLSNIATPFINTYKAALDLKELKFVAEDEVKALTLYINYLQHNSEKPLHLPGEEVMITGQLFAVEKKDYTPAIELTDEGYDNLVINAKQFYGALRVQNQAGSKHYTLVDGLRYITKPSQAKTNGSSITTPGSRSYVTVDGDIRQAPAEKHLDKLKQSLQFNFTFAQAADNTLKANQPERSEVENFVHDSLLWITEIIPATNRDADLLNIRVQALDLAHVDDDRSLGSFVPLLPFNRYQAQVEKILALLRDIDFTIDRYHQDIEIRKTQELIINVGKDLNKNIIASGKLLSGYVDASIEQQKSLSGYYGSIINEKKQELQKQEDTVGNLRSEVTSQQADVGTAVANYKQAIEDWRITEAIKFGLTVATDLFSLGTSFLIPASSISAVKDLGLLAQRIQKFLNVANATMKLFTDTSTGVDKFVKAQEAFDGIENAVTADLPWDEMSILMDQVLSTGPNDPNVNEKKAALVAAFKIYVLKGKALSAAMSSTRQTAQDIYSRQQQKNLLDEQIGRLEKLDTDLNPATINDLDKNAIDLMGLTGTLSMVRSQMLGMLARAFTLQDQALQYTYLQPPTPIHSFDTLGIQSAIVTQGNNTLAAETAWRQFQPSTTTPLDVEVEVPVEELRDGKIYHFNIQPNFTEFLKYVDVRVKAVVARVDGIKSTDSGEYLVKLDYTGRPFYDRNADRQTIVFNTLQRERTYEYKVEGNKPKFSDKGDSWSEGVNPITPFSVWELSLPKTRTNKNMAFEDLTVKVVLTFVLNTRIHDTRSRLLQAFRLTADGVSVNQKPSVQQLVGQMAEKSVMNNWDVVFNMDLAKINNVLASQYDKLKNNDREYGGKITADSAVQGANIGDILTYVLQKFNLSYGYPQLTFLVNDGSNGDLNMEITSGTVQKGSRYVGSDTQDDRNTLEVLARANNLPPDAVKEQTIGGVKKLVLEYYNDPEPIGSTATLRAVIKIDKVKGLVNDNQDILSVVLDMQKGSFSAKNIEIDMSDQQKVAFSDAVKAYFQEHPVMFIINSLDLSGIATLPDMKPNQFLFKALKTQGGNELLQLFIQTNKRAVFNYSQTYISPDVPEPIPEGAECSLMINSRIMFGSVMPSSLTSGWSLKGDNPGDTNKAWSAEATQASIEGDVDLSSLDGSYTAPRSFTTSYWKYEPWGGNPVKWSLDGMKITPGTDGRMSLNYSKKNPFYFNEKTRSCSFWCSDWKDNKQSTDITLVVSASLPTKVSGTGRNQEIQINAGQINPNAEARTSGGGPCGSDDLQAQINAKLQPQVKETLGSKFNISFSGVSVFALKNLLFPSNNYIKLSDAYVPGDLLITGTFEEDA